jgi:hypothetical protein
MAHESKAMKEIHDIRLRNYEQSRHLGRKELLARINEQGKAAIKRLGLKPGAKV